MSNIDRYGSGPFSGSKSDLRRVHNMTLGAASCRVILGQVGRLCPKSTSLGRKQECYVGYAGIEFGSIPASRCVSAAFQRGMTRRNATPSVIIIVNQPLWLIVPFFFLYC